MPIKHAFTNPKSDGGDATVTRPSDWNADHVIDEEGVVASASQSTVVTLSSGNTNVDLCSLTITDAPAGVYVGAGNFYVNSVGTSNVILEASSNGGSYTTLDERDCRTTAGDRSMLGTYTHTGGDLAVRMRGIYESSNATLGLSDDTRWGRNLVVLRAAPAVKTGNVTVHSTYLRTSANYTTTSSTLAAVDGTDGTFSKTFTPAANSRIRIAVAGTITHSGTQTIGFAPAIDGTPIGGTAGLWQVNASTNSFNASWTWISEPQTNASHTYAVFWRTSAATATLRGDSALQAFCSFEEIGG